MSKTTKKLDNNVIKALTIVCEAAKAQIDGFVWLTHTADYSRFPGSLKIICVFATDAQMTRAQSQSADQRLIQDVQQTLFKAGILLKNAKQHVTFDTEESGAEARWLN
ncbi:MAG: Fis family transcriptional regulator [Glaciecola sp.]|jgi:hypothetical protein|nr:Fis family transcriptional regulator [Glaciecola sp.]MDG1815887.1 Fis family transcriptional regulator [Glaciecola sp.]MDG2098257.1 Fis family transcriptional regulator [Glaciecola sp.]